MSSPIVIAGSVQSPTGARSASEFPSSTNNATNANSSPNVNGSGSNRWRFTRPPVPRRVRPRAAWLLVTGHALRWQFVVDGVPGSAANPEAPRPEGPRNAEYASLQPVDIGFAREFVGEHAGPFGAAAFDYFGFRQSTMTGDWIHAIG